jgi:hypothetical protein
MIFTFNSSAFIDIMISKSVLFLNGKGFNKSFSSLP